MRNLLLGAKYFAQQSNSAHIELAHVATSLNCLQAVDDEGYEVLETALNSGKLEDKQALLTTELLEQVAAEPRLAYSTQVTQLIKRLKSFEYDMSFVITEPFVDTVATIGAYHQIVAEVAEVKALLSNQVFDQDHAIEVVSDAVMQMAWADKANRPRAIFFFLGPPATGKTYLSELLGKGLQGYGFKSFDMTQYVSEQDGFGLTGLRKGFSDAAPGHLTEFVKEHPKSIIVFDELEKSHTRVQMTLLRILSSGIGQDEYHMKEVDFRETIIVFTSNLGSALYSNQPHFLGAGC